MADKIVIVMKSPNLVGQNSKFYLIGAHIIKIYAIYIKNETLNEVFWGNDQRLIEMQAIILYSSL